MGRVRFIQDTDFTSILTCGLCTPNHTFYLVNEDDKILYTLEEHSSSFSKLCCTNGVGTYEATLYLGMKNKELAHYK